MSRRIDIELTSQRDESTWTWRAAGAKHPKGTLDSSLLPKGAGTGDVLKADIETDLDGVVVTSITSARARPSGLETLAVIGSGRDDGGVTTNYVERKGKGKGRGDRNRGKQGDKRRDNRGEGGDDRKGNRDRPARDNKRRQPPPEDAKPKPKRLRPGRVHRNALVASLPPEEQPIAEQVVRGGIPAVRTAIDEQNERAKKEGLPEVNGEPLLAIAEKLTGRVRGAEWRDRADAALESSSEIDIRDLRSVVVAAEDAAKGTEAREIAQKLRDALSARVEAEHKAWLDEMTSILAEGRVVRVLRLSSRPPKAGSPLPAEFATELAKQASEAMNGEITQQRWATVLDALAFSPVRSQVTPLAFPEEPNEELSELLKKVAAQLPEIAGHYGIKPTRKRRSPAKKRPPAPAKASASKPDAKTKATPEAASEPTKTETAPEAASEPTKTETAPEAASEPTKTETTD